MLKNRLEWWTERNNILPKTQTGFRKGQSTIDNLTNLSLNVDEAFSNKKHLLAAFFDVSSAFDNVSTYKYTFATIGNDWMPHYHD